MTVKQIFNTSAELDYPTVLPTLDLDFANSKTLDPRITFTRSSGGSYVGADGFIKLAGVNEARFDHNPVTGESLGLLVEEPRTNLQGNSEVLTAASWSNSFITVARPSTVGPNGQTAYQVTETTATSVHNIIGGGAAATSTTSVVSGSIYTASIFLKKSTVDWIQLTFGATGFGSTYFANFNLDTGVIGNTGGSITAQMVPYANGWYRCIVTATATTTSAVSNNLIIVFTDNTNTTSRAPSYTGSTANKVFAFMAQFELGAFPTSYIPTVASTRTRAGDNALITGKNFSDFFNFNEGTSFVSFKFGPTTDASRNFLNYNALVGSVIVQRTNSAGATHALSFTPVLRDSISVGISNTEIFTAPYITGNSCFTYKSGDIAYSTSGIIQYTNNLTFLPLNNPESPAVSLSISAVSSSLNGTISRVRYFPKRLPDSQIRALTR